MSHKFSHRVASLFMALAIAFAGVTPALAAPPLIDNFAGPEAIPSLPFSATVDITDATNESGEPQACWFMDRTAWYSFTPSQTVTVRAYTQGIISNVNIYRLDGAGISDLSFLECAAFGIPTGFLAEAGQTYYLQVGPVYGQVGSIQLNLEEVSPPLNDNFASATVIFALPFDDSVDTLGATLEAGEPTPSCDFDDTDRTVWYAFTPAASGSLSASFTSAYFSTITAAYTGNSLANLIEVGCRAFGNTLTFQATANTTYYFQVGGIFGYDGGPGGFHLDVTPPIVADFFFNPSDPSVLGTVQFCDYSFDPGGVGFQSMTWDFGDGATSTDNCAFHQYAADGDYTVQHSVTTFDGRTASTSQVVQVRTHDVSIIKVAAPRSASVGQTRAITVSIKNNRYPETVRIELYRSVSGGGFELIGVSTQFVPVRSGNRTSQFTFNYTFSPQDAQVGKVTFRAVVVIENANDAFQPDNDAISTPPTVVKR